MYPIAVEKVAAALGGERILKTKVATVGDLHAAVRRGLPRGVVRELAKAAAHGRDDRMRVAHLVASEATLKRGEILSVAASERAERLARVVALAHDVLGDPARAQDWLHTPNLVLRGAPILLAATDLGARQVEQVLANIEYGLPA
jgi:putative toxin-antitoxin system antitoxin component (TIGR02293 family)